MRAVVMLKWLSALALVLATSTNAQTTVRYVHTDALGSVVALTDQNRVVVERREYEPYGQQLTPAVADGPGYTGHVQDAATALTYMQQRYYDPAIGRFLSVDPVAASSVNGANFNRYIYANNNPYRFTDPDGRNPVVLAAGACVLISPCGAAVVTTTAIVIYYVTGADEKLAEALSQRNENAEEGGNEKAPETSDAPPLPGELVGEQDDPRAGPNKSGNRHTSGPLRGDKGGSGDYETDLETLAGKTRPQQPGDSAPPGSQVGANGVFGRENSSGGRSIDIPRNGDKPHETLHY